GRLTPRSVGFGDLLDAIVFVDLVFNAIGNFHNPQLRVRSVSLSAKLLDHLNQDRVSASDVVLRPVGAIWHYRIAIDICGKGFHWNAAVVMNHLRIADDRSRSIDPSYDVS